MRVIIILRPSNLELIRWMFDRRDERFVSAANHALYLGQNLTLEMIPYYALLLSLLYPSMTATEIKDILEQEHLLADAIVLGLQLVGAQRGYSEL